MLWQNEREGTFNVSRIPMHVAILITCFNRRDITLKCLKRLSHQTGVDSLNIEIFLVDDASKDGTGEAVRQKFPAVHLLKGDGSLYWNGGMRMAFAAAMARGFDAYIFLNDDTFLDQNALQRLTSDYRQCAAMVGAVIMIGSVCDEKTGVHTYGGLIRSTRGLRVDLLPVPATDSVQSCETMNGNFVLIPASVVAQLGNLDANFTHSMGDLDYGLRATKLRIPVRIAAGNMGTCSENARSGTWRDSGLPMRQRWRHITSPKGLPIGDWFLYTRRHFGWRWPIYALFPYLKTILGL